MRYILQRIACIFFLLLFVAMLPLAAQTPSLPNPVMFVTQLPIPHDWMRITQTFGNHIGRVGNCGRGGDLYIRYTDGTLRNLTEEAGYGNSGFQGSNSIAVRDPHVHWDGEKAVFSMVIGATETQYQHINYYWQIYEVTGLGQGETAVITRVANQPEEYNNISPIYGSDDQIIFTSDRPRNGERHLYPQLDEYESVETVTGLYSLEPLSGELKLLTHSPSGSFDPSIDSFGRIISVRWDHLQRDQQNYDGAVYGAYNWTDESATSTATTSVEEVYPEPRTPGSGSNLNGHTMELFFPWQMNQDGTNEEVLNHIGRHELSNYFNRARNDDPDLQEFIAGNSGRTNANSIRNLFQVRESQTTPGNYYGVDAPTFFHFTSGNIVMLNGAPNVNPDDIYVTHITQPGFDDGHYRHPLPLSDGSLIAAHTSYTGAVANLGDRSFPRSPFKFRLKTLVQSGDYSAADAYLTDGIYKAVNFWDPDVMVTYADSIAMWEFSPVEVVARTRPQATTSTLPLPEQQVMDEEGVDVAALQAYMEQNDLALIISRNITTRDGADRQQPFNLRVAGSATQTTGNSGQIYDVAHLQLFQGDQIRSYASYTSGRRVLAQPMHDDGNLNPENPDGPSGSVKISDDGSFAAFVPANRAMTWQLTDEAGEGVVRERYWVTFAPGEIRVCTSCHGINSTDQAGNAAPQNMPDALRTLMQHYLTDVAVTENPDILPESPLLVGNYPNPFNPSTSIIYSLPSRQQVKISVYNLLGQEIAVLINDIVPAGNHNVRWEPANLSSGVYIAKLETAGHTAVRKMVLMK